MIGEIKAEHQTATAFMLSDPKADLTLIPAGDIADVQTSKKFVRIYIPRTEQKLTEGFDVIELFDFVPYILETQHFQWIRDAVHDHGLGLALTEMGWYSVTDWTGNDAGAWMATVVYDAYPVDLVLNKQNMDTAYMDIKQTDPLVDLPDFEKTPMTGVLHHGIEVARPGSTVIAVWRAGQEDAIVAGTYGQAKTLMIPMGWDNVPTETRKWYYYVDFVLNHLYFVAQVKIPEDLAEIHELRTDFVEYYDQKAMASSLLEFVDKFGANTRPLEAMLGDLDLEKKQAENLYLRDDYAGALDVMAEVLAGFQTVSDEAVRVRERALLWVYIIEYLVVTGTSAIVGSVLWALMVRRRLYKEVAVTRARGA